MSMLPESKVQDLMNQVDEDPEMVKEAFNLMLDNMPSRTKEKKLKQKLNNAEDPEEMKKAIKNYIS